MIAFIDDHRQAYGLVARLIRRMGLHGVVRGRKVRTTTPDPVSIGLETGPRIGAQSGF